MCLLKRFWTHLVKFPALLSVGNRRVTFSAAGINQKDVSPSLDSDQTRVLYSILLFISMSCYQYDCH